MAGGLGLFWFSTKVVTMQAAYKLGYFNPEEQPFLHPNTWAVEETSGPSRLVIAPAKDQVKLLLRMMEVMPEPFWVLYVLTVSRAGNQLGRYQSAEPKNRESIKRFLGEFAQFLENDGRHHLWIGSEPGPELLVYDRHNKIYAYGPLEQFSEILSEIGLTPAPSIEIPSPHSHHYNQTYDETEASFVNYWEWLRTPLLDSDDE
jgi:hypothetical protein